MNMIRKTRSYRDIRMDRLADPQVAASYLNVTMQNSPDNFLSALKNVAQARQIARVAKDAGVQRETLYRSLSDQGNPTYDTLLSILTAVGIRINFSPLEVEAASTLPHRTPATVPSQDPMRNTRINVLGNLEDLSENASPLWGGGAHYLHTQEALTT